jgi:hypothetical protein
MNPRALRVLYEVLAAGGLNRALAAADVPDSRLVELVDGVAPLPRVARWTWVAAPDVAPCAWPGTTGTQSASTCLAAQSTRLALALSALPLRPRSSTATSPSSTTRCRRRLQPDRRQRVLLRIVRASARGLRGRCYSGGGEGSAAADGRVHQDPRRGAGIGEDDLRRRFNSWDVRTNVKVPVGEIMRHTRIPFPLRPGLCSGRLEIRRFELSRID